ncbi:lysis protein [Salmonella enterica]|uniref:Lysis protein n=1 Tax=Salmonella enterica TaxID=28901 RepID=A0A3V7Z2Q6_SALER|nr:lysis protein [Salmonella enterica]EAZ3130291.1 lysis protein [Salmonella enterica]ELC2813589.1 lysis protein [Salmonella enterica]MMS76472.1 lysis protein [Salmonella enterica]HAF4825313.1 lysis protein [Salmonella enterica]
MERITSHASYGVPLATTLTASIYSFLDGFSHDEWYAIGIATGVFFGFISLVANIYFQRQRNRILERQKNADQDKS